MGRFEIPCILLVARPSSPAERAISCANVELGDKDQVAAVVVVAAVVPLLCLRSACSNESANSPARVADGPSDERLLLVTRRRRRTLSIDDLQPARTHKQLPLCVASTRTGQARPAQKRRPLLRSRTRTLVHCRTLARSLARSFVASASVVRPGGASSPKQCARPMHCRKATAAASQLETRALSSLAS